MKQTHLEMLYTSGIIARVSAISITDLIIARSGKRIIDKISVSIPVGKVVGLLGPSGSGKTTLMRAIIGAQQITSGEIFVVGEKPGDKELRQRVSYMNQSISIYTDLTIYENFQYFASLYQSSNDLINEILNRVDLVGLSQQLVRNLSGGEQSRVSLGIAMLNDPEVLILDEPTVGLDPVLRRDLWKLFKKLAGDGKTLLISSHVMDEAERCDEIIFMRDGKIVVTGEPFTLQERASATSMESTFLYFANLNKANDINARVNIDGVK